MTELVLQTRVNQYLEQICQLEAKIDEKLEKVDYDEDNLGTMKGIVTRWRNKIKEHQANIEEAKAEIKTLKTAPKSEGLNSSMSGQSGGGTLSKELKRLQHDFNNHPRFAPPLDVAVFARSMQVLYDTHVKHNIMLENDFVQQVECHIDTTYRVQLQRYIDVNERFSSWKDMKTYLVETHRSCTTLFQEMGKFTNIPMRNNETVKEYCQRVKTAGEEAETIIRSKLKDELNAEPTARDIFELMQMDAVVRQMQAHPKFRDDYNMIVNQIDSCTTIDMLSQKASKIADRKVHVDELSDPRTFINSKSQPTSCTSRTDSIDKAVEKAMSKHMNAFMAQSHTHAQKTQPAKDSSNKMKSNKKSNDSRYKHWSDPEWRRKKVNEPCHMYQRDNSCNRTNCPFAPCNKKSTEFTLYSKVF